MFTIIVLLYLQQGLEVTLERATLHGGFHTRAECEAAATRLRGPVPIPHTYAAAWHDALCVPINRDVHVNETAPLELGKLLQQAPAQGCQAEGAWRRVAELCAPQGHER